MIGPVLAPSPHRRGRGRVCALDRRRADTVARSQRSHALLTTLDREEPVPRPVPWRLMIRINTRRDQIPKAMLRYSNSHDSHQPACKGPVASCSTLSS